MIRFRRLRANTAIRGLVRETALNIDDFIYPLFIVEGQGIRKEIPSMPDVYHLSVDELQKEVRELADLGLTRILLFGLPDEKDEWGSTAYDDNGIVQKAVRAVKEVCPHMYVITDVCLCQYTSQGHCGMLSDTGEIMNDPTLDYLGKVAISHLKAGADMIAPSDMMDGRIGFLRNLLDAHGYEQTPILSYSAKYASNYYGPFRAAAASAPQFGDRKTYQMDFHNSDEAIRAMENDIKSGADLIMVKPALSYLDIIRRAKDTFNMPVVAYNVSGEYTMIMNAVQAGVVNESIIYETLISMKRAGASIIITYFAKKIAIEMRGQSHV